jgi:MYXO-CTERM domain-containing protein
MKISIAAAIAAATVVASASADVVAYWNQNSNGLPVSGFGFEATDFPQAADVGSGSITVGGGIASNTITNANGVSVYEWVESFGGSTLGAINSDVAGGGICLEGGTGNANNGAYFQFAFSMAGYSDLAITYATRGTSTGFNAQTWSWSTDGVNFTDFQTVAGTNVTTYFLATLGTLNALDGASTAFLRVTFNGATSSSGNNRLDNILFQATAVPAPGAIALLGLAGLVGRRRR